MRRCRIRSTLRWTHGALAGWRWEKTRAKNCLTPSLSANIGTSNLPVPELKRLCSNVALRARFVIEFCLTKSCAPAFNINDVSRAIRLRRDSEKHCRVARAFAHGRVVRLVANPLHSAAGDFDATHGRARAIYVGGSRSRPRRSGFWRDVRRDF